MFRTFKALKSFVTPLLSYSAILVFNSLTHFSSWVPHVLVHNLNGDGSQGRRILLSLSLCFTRASETASWLPFLDVVFHLLVQEEARRISCRLLDENYILTKMYCLCCCSFSCYILYDADERNLLLLPHLISYQTSSIDEDDVFPTTSFWRLSSLFFLSLPVAMILLWQSSSSQILSFM